MAPSLTENRPLVLDFTARFLHIHRAVKLSSRGRYGVCALFDMAFHADGRAAQVKDIAERQGIPPRFLEQIFQDLKRAGLVTSKRGPRGGYRLARETQEIPLGDIIRALEGPIAIGVLGEPVADEGGDARSRRVVDEALADLSRNVEACFDRVTLADLCARGDDLGVRRRAREKLVYVI